jgi:hypothetical protein
MTAGSTTATGAAGGLVPPNWVWGPRHFERENGPHFGPHCVGVLHDVPYEEPLST